MAKAIGMKKAQPVTKFQKGLALAATSTNTISPAATVYAPRSYSVGISRRNLMGSL
jgi:hypothetical protein